MKHQILKKGIVSGSISYIYLSLLAIVAIFPLFWVLISSVKSKGEITGSPTKIWPTLFSGENYRIVLDNLGFTTNILNSVIVALSVTLVAVSISALAAYGIVRFFPRAGNLMMRTLITTYMFPPILLAVPFSMIIGKMRLANTHFGLVIVYLSFSVPYAIWMLVGFFKTVPLEIEEAATVDGANQITVFGRIALPVVTPGLVAVAIYTFINAWNEFLFALILINSTEKMTVSVALKSLEGSEIFDWGTMMAASAVVVIPSVLFFMLIQKKIAGGLTQGSIK